MATIRKTFGTVPTGLVLVISVGLLLRLAWLWWLRDMALWLDEAEYLQIAQAIRSGGYLDTFLWLRVPLFPTWLAVTLGPTDSPLLAQLGQVALGTVLLYQIYRIGQLVWGSAWIATVAGLIAALYLPLIAFSRYLMAEMLLLTVLAALLLLLLHIARESSQWRVAQAGALLGCAALIKPIGAVAGLALLVAIWFGTQSWRQRTILTGIALGCAALVLIPWAGRNLVVHQHPILLDTTGGYNAWFGNIALEHDPMFDMLVYETYPTDLVAREQAFLARAQANIAAAPLAALQDIGTKLGSFWRLEADLLATRTLGEVVVPCGQPLPEPQHGILSADDLAGHRAIRFCERLWVNLAADLVYLPLLGGLALTLFQQHPRRFVLIGLAWIVPFYLATVFTVVQPRLRLPLLLVIIPWSVAGWVFMIQFMQRYWVDMAGQASQPHLFRRWQLWVGGLLVVGLLWLLQIPALFASQIYHTLGWQAWQQGEPRQALLHFRSAASWYPTRIGSLVAAGQVAEALGYDNEALAWYDAATQQISYEPEPRIGAARILMQQGNVIAAQTELDRTLMGSARTEAWAFVAPALPTRTTIDLGNIPEQAALNYGYVIGLYPPSGGESFRPTGKAAAVRFGTLPTPPAVLEFRASGARPAGAPSSDVGLELETDRMTQGTTPMTITLAPDWRTYQVLVPPTAHGVTVMLKTETFIPAQLDPNDRDTRAYGLALDWARLAPERLKHRADQVPQYTEEQHRYQQHTGIVLLQDYAQTRRSGP